jgi:hypothetical protein
MAVSTWVLIFDEILRSTAIQRRFLYYMLCINSSSGEVNTHSRNSTSPSAHLLSCHGPSRVCELSCPWGRADHAISKNLPRTKKAPLRLIYPHCETRAEEQLLVPLCRPIPESSGQIPRIVRKSLFDLLASPPQTSILNTSKTLFDA